ncbi:MAG TPA: hypothetical protein PKU78_01720 [Candidatus Dojkabacteria bacterium]|nr:hypothetical protein [Candidatus Dojkabacteria bacterium]HRO64916.1 hypothetical protein [Candidatus Dojkabacteria bacterium]HRP36734.1 hypothetical protein [Candidatus Dojkabacteria bacterium]HRP51298.1 hypothetical protein [Candidatus Dojkabacteria bacterium]
MDEGEKYITPKDVSCGDIRRRNIKTLLLASIPPLAFGIAGGIFGYHVEPSAMAVIVGASGGTAAGLAVDLVATSF